MEMDNTNNRIALRGTVFETPVFSHQVQGTRFWQVPIEVSRLSGAVDTLTLLLREDMALDEERMAAAKLDILGEVRSFNNRSGVGSRLQIFVFVREARPASGPDTNTVTLTGTLCKPPALRTTPLGREICDLMLAVNRRYGRSDYLPCIAWGQRAQAAAALGVGDRLSLTGRLQSRRYVKVLPEGPQDRVAYEISVTDLAGA